MEDENQIINENVANFLSKNSQRYESLSGIFDLSDETFQNVVESIKQNANILFKDHSSNILFFNYICQASKFNFKKAELYSDLICIFKNKIKSNNTTEHELISICYNYSCVLNLLFIRNFFSIESIVDKSFQLDEIFITFLPEIENYDSEYAQKRLKIILAKKQSNNLTKYYEFVKSNPEQHLFYRQLNYHPSPLHKSIRDDDIELFQSLLSKNNIDINYRIEYSFYERVKQLQNKEMSLIQTAAFYGSIKIFKFLMIQNNIIIDDNLLSYAYSGFNLDIIHICENKKCSLDNVYIKPIMTHRKDLLDYYIENFRDEILEKDVEIKNQLKKFKQDENNKYEILDYIGLSSAFLSMNFDVILSSLRKIVFIIKNYENDCSGLNKFSKIDFLKESSVDFEMFKFLYSQRKLDFDFQKWKGCKYLLDYIIDSHSNDSFKYLLNDCDDDSIGIQIFSKGISVNYEVVCFLLDKLLNEKDKNVAMMFQMFFNPLLLSLAVEFYNEDVIVKLIQVIQFNNEEQVELLVNLLNDNLSIKMMLALMDRILSFLEKEQMIMFANAFKKLQLENINTYILNKLK